MPKTAPMGSAMVLLAKILPKTDSGGLPQVLPWFLLFKNMPKIAPGGCAIGLGHTFATKNLAQNWDRGGLPRGVAMVFTI